MKPSDSFDGIVEKLNIDNAAAGTLSGTCFAVKDLFDVAGYTAGAGNPQWQHTHAQAQRNAVAIDLLLQAGARLVAKTCTDELAYSLDGVNIHYGTPVNPQAPNRIPGGSSSGSASVVAKGLVDFALGTDTSGSIRVPAAYCGLYSMRPTEGAISTHGVAPLAPSYDTVGWLAKTPELLSRCGEVLLAQPAAVDKAPNFQGPLLFLHNAFEIAHQDVAPYLVQASEALKKYYPRCQSASLSEHSALTQWSDAYRILQAAEVWQTLGRWINDSKPHFAPEIEQRFVFASTVSSSQVNQALFVRAQAIAAIDRLLADGAVLCLPTTWNIAPLLSAAPDARDYNRSQNFKLTCIATLFGAPQVTVPIPGPDGLRIGLSFIAGKGQDVQLLKLAHQTHDFLSRLERSGVPKFV